MIKQTTTLSFVLFGLISLTACQSTDDVMDAQSNTVTTNTPSQTAHPHQRITTSPAAIPVSQAHTHLHKPYTMPNQAIKMVVGEYVDSGYAQRHAGYDWVKVTISAVDNQNIAITVESRQDIKQPTCHYQGQAHFIGQDAVHGALFKNLSNDTETFFQFKNDVLTIDAKDKQALYFFCSGGATLAGEYTKIATE